MSLALAQTQRLPKNRNRLLVAESQAHLAERDGDFAGARTSALTRKI
jgi:hypothetical protein